MNLFLHPSPSQGLPISPTMIHPSMMYTFPPWPRTATKDMLGYTLQGFPDFSSSSSLTFGAQVSIEDIFRDAAALPCITILTWPSNSSHLFQVQISNPPRSWSSQLPDLSPWCSDRSTFVASLRARDFVLFRSIYWQIEFW